MSALVPLVVAVPLLAAAAITALGHFVPTELMNALAIAVSASVAGMGIALLVAVWDHDIVYWFAGWEVRDDVALGIAFTVGPFGAALTAFVGFLAAGALVFTWRAFREQRVGYLFYTLMLVFVAGMVGFALTGDLFNLFVFFELMSVAAYALTAYQVRRTRVLQGALGFAVTNSIGAFLILFGIAFLYGQTAALNLADIGAALADGEAGGPVVAGFALVIVGFLVKAGAVPFHFWLSDAYAVAPAPVAALLSAVMGDLAFFAIAKVYWTAFSGAFADADEAVRGVLVVVGVASALVGGVMCLLHGDLKRLLAFVTVAHGGIFLVGVGLLTTGGLAGAIYYLVADGLVKGALLLGVGACIHLLGSADEQVLRGRGRARRLIPLAAVFGAGAVGLAAAPPLGPFVGKELIQHAATEAGLGWLPPLLTLATILTAASVFRAGGRIFLGLGPRDDPLLASQRDEPAEPTEDEQEARTERRLVAPALVFLAVSFALSAVPDLAGRAHAAAERLMDRERYVAHVLRGVVPPGPPAVPEISITAAGWAYGAASIAAALALAALLLHHPRLPRKVRALGRRLSPVESGLRSAHQGALGDYVAWLIAGTAVVGGVWSLTLG